MLAVAGLILLVLVAGAVNGLAGFGFALIATMGLAAVVDPATAVAFIILPMVAVNLALVGERARRAAVLGLLLVIGVRLSLAAVSV